MSGRRFRLWLALPTFLILGAAVLYPLLRLVVTATRGPAWLESDPFFWRVVAFTYAQATLSAILSLIVGGIGAWAFSELDFPGRRWLWRLSLLCFSLPTLLVVLALVGSWNAYGWRGILLANTFFNFPLFLRGLGLALREGDRTLEKAALSLGASRARVFGMVTLRRLRPALQSAFFLAFLFSASNLVIVLMLGGGPRFTTLEVAMFEAIKVDLDLPQALKLASVQAGVSLALYLLFLRGTTPMRLGGRETFVSLFAFRKPTWNRVALGSYALLLLALAGAPLLLLLGRGTLQLRAALETGLSVPALTSLGLAALVAVLALTLAFPLCYFDRRGRGELGGMLASMPLALSPLLLSLALLSAYPALASGVRGNLIALAGVQSLAALPLTYRALRDGFARIPDTLYQSAASLGAGPWPTLWRVELPLLRRAIFLGGLLAATLSLGEVSAILIFGSEGIETLPLRIYRLMGSYQFGAAEGAGAVLLVLVTGLLAVVGRAEEGRDELEA